MYKDPTNTHIIFMSQEPVELTPELLETFSGKYVKTGNGTTLDPCEEFCKLPEEKKAEFITGMIKIIEKNEAEKQNKVHETKFKELREKHHLILPCVIPGEVSFTFKGVDSGRHNYFYFKSSTQWEPWGGNETPEARAVMDDLVQAGIITKDGKVNFEHHI